MGNPTQCGHSSRDNFRAVATTEKVCLVDPPQSFLLPPSVGIGTYRENDTLGDKIPIKLLRKIAMEV